MNISSELSKIEAVIPKLEKWLQRIENKISNLQQYFWGEDIDWQRSDEGEEYWEKITDMEDKHANVKYEIDQIKSAIENLKKLKSNK